jgi:hypothetical protein
MMIQRLQSTSIVIQLKICLTVTMNQHHFCTTVPPLSGVDLPQNGQLFERYYIRFLLELRERHTFPQNTVQSITTYLYSLLEIIFEMIRTRSSAPYPCRSSPFICANAVFLFMNLLNSNIINVDEQIKKGNFDA